MRSDLDHGGEEDWRNPIHTVHPVYLTCLANYSMQPNNLMEYVLLHISKCTVEGNEPTLAGSRRRRAAASEACRAQVSMSVAYHS